MCFFYLCGFDLQFFPLWVTVKKTRQFLINYFLREKHYVLQSMGIIKKKKVVQTRPVNVQGTFQKAQYITLLERGTKVRRTCVHISRSDSAAVGTSLIQNNPDCSGRDKWACHRAHAFDEKGRICPSGCWIRQSKAAVVFWGGCLEFESSVEMYSYFVQCAAEVLHVLLLQGGQCIPWM